ILLGGVPGVLPAEVLILGGGVVGANAAKMAAGLGAHVTLLDLSLDRLRYLSDVLPPNVDLLYSNRHNLLDQLRKADVVIGAVLLLGLNAIEGKVVYAAVAEAFGLPLTDATTLV